MDSKLATKQILVIEDEREIRELVQILLIRQGFNVMSLSSVEEFYIQRQKSEAQKFDLVVLDWMLPGKSGFDFLRELRRIDDYRTIPIIMVTAKAEPEEVVLGLEHGADDYLVKPFDSGVLIARVKALLRRTESIDENASAQWVNWGDLRVDLLGFEAFIKDEKLPLTPTEFKLLSILSQQHGKVFTREQLVQSVQGEGVNVIGRTIDTHVFSLRKKMGDLGDWIETSRGIGYRFRMMEGQEKDKDKEKDKGQEA